MLALFDLDGFLYDFESYLVTTLEKKYGLSARANRDMYNLEERFLHYPEIREDALKIQKDFVTYRYLNVDLSARSFVIQAIQRGYEVMFLTSRPRGAKRVTENRLKSLFGTYYDQTYGVEFTLSKTGYIEPFKSIVAFLVDDNPEEVETLNKIGVKAFAWNQPWNEHIYPNIQPDRDGVIWLRPSENEDGDYFWNYME